MAEILPHRPVNQTPMLTDAQFAVLDAQDVLERLAERLGSYSRVARILRSLAIIHGEAV